MKPCGALKLATELRLSTGSLLVVVSSLPNRQFAGSSAKSSMMQRTNSYVMCKRSSGPHMGIMCKRCWRCSDINKKLEEAVGCPTGGDEVGERLYSGKQCFCGGALRSFLEEQLLLNLVNIAYDHFLCSHKRFKSLEQTITLT
jgi:hypothetical protein